MRSWLFVCVRDSNDSPLVVPGSSNSAPGARLYRILTTDWHSPLPRSEILPVLSLVSAMALVDIVDLHCIICFDAFTLDERPPVILPCGHTYVCAQCAKRLDKCMECRKPLFIKPQACVNVNEPLQGSGLAANDMPSWYRPPPSASDAGPATAPYSGSEASAADRAHCVARSQEPRHDSVDGGFGTRKARANGGKEKGQYQEGQCRRDSVLSNPRTECCGVARESPPHGYRYDTFSVARLVNSS